MKRKSCNLKLSRLAALTWTVLMVAPASHAFAAGAINPSPMLLGTTVAAADCSYEAVDAAVKTATSMNLPGLTVAIPAGTCSWTDKELRLSGRIALKGAGRDLTIIKRTAAVSQALYLIKFDCRVYKNATFSDMTLAGSNPYLGRDNGLGLIGTCVDFKVKNAKFTHFASSAVEVRGGPTQSGVIYSNQFVNNYASALGTLGYGVVVYGEDDTWPELKLGMEKDPALKYPSTVFVEDNYMMGNRHHIASNRGARYVFRYNRAIATEATKNFPQVDAHGKLAFGIGARSWEVYNNNFSADLLSGGNIAIGMRGGDGVIFNNTYDSTITKPIVLELEGQESGQNVATICEKLPADAPGIISDAFISETARTGLVTNLCPTRIRLGYEYRMEMRPGYTPFTYPHPLRAN